MTPKGASAGTNHLGYADASAGFALTTHPIGEELYKDGRYLELHPTWHVEDSSWKAKQIFKLIDRNRLQPKSIAEIGCGAGEVINQLHLIFPDSCSFSGYEISPQALELCKRRESPGLQFHLRDLLQEETAYFDIVLCIDVFEHVENYLGFLGELRQKGRYKIFHIPLDLSVQAVLRSSPIIRYRQTLGHIHYFAKETALATLTDTGYEILDYSYTAHSLDLPAKSFKAFLAKTPRKIMHKLYPDLTVRMLGGFSLLVLTR